MEIFVLSMHRCGTQTIHNFLQKAGFRSGHNPSGKSSLDFQHLWKDRHTDLNFIFNTLIERSAPHFNAISDNPMAALYEQAFERFPKAKFILSSRNTSGWIKSVRNHIGDREMVPAEKIQYWKFSKKRPNRISDLSDTDLEHIFQSHQSFTQAFFACKGASSQLFKLDLNISGLSNQSRQLSHFLGIPPQSLDHIDIKGRRRIPPLP